MATNVSSYSRNHSIHTPQLPDEFLCSGISRKMHQKATEILYKGPSVISLAHEIPRNIVDMTGDLEGITRNFMRSIPAIAQNAKPFISGMSVTAGFLTTISGLFTIKDGVFMVKEGVSLKDEETFLSGIGTSMAGTCVTGAGICWAIGMLSPCMTTAMGAASGINPLFMAAGVASGSVAAVQLGKTARFRHKLNKTLNINYKNEEDKYIDALSLLEASLRPTEAETKFVWQKLCKKYPKLSKEKIEIKFIQELKKLYRKKRASFERNTNARCAQEISGNVKGYIADLQKYKKAVFDCKRRIKAGGDSNSIKNAKIDLGIAKTNLSKTLVASKKMINMTKSANTKKIIRNVLLVTMAVFSILICLAFLFFPGGILPIFIAFMLLGGAMLAMDIHDSIFIKMLLGKMKKLFSFSKANISHPGYMPIV